MSAARAYTSLMPAVARRQSCQFRQIKQLKFVGVAGTKLRRLQVDSPDPVALGAEKRNEVMTDEPTRAGDQNLT